jgi:hypothetical protein
VTLAEAFADQATSCLRLGSPFMGRLFEMLARHWPEDSRLAARLDAFEGDIGPAGASLPLRVAGGLHALVLDERAPDLVHAYPPHAVPDEMLRETVLHSLTAHEDFLLDWIESPPQTNEVRRAAVLMAGAAEVRRRFDLPVCLSELGASGGLNLMWNRFAVALPDRRLGAGDAVLTLMPDWQGDPPPPDLPVIAERAGVDLNPLNPGTPTDFLRLMAFLWPDQPHRLALTRAAASVMDAPLFRGDAIDWLEHRLQAAPAGHVHIIQHTVAWQYFPAAAQTRGQALIEAAGRAATPDRPIAWLAMESDGDTKGAVGALIRLRLWPGDLTLDLGRADFHGRWVRWAGTA